jgi:fumarate hydratase class II
MLNMAMFHVQGCDLTVSLASQAGQLELNVMMPVIAYNLIQSIHLLTNAVQNFTQRCIEGLEADRERCEEMIEKSLALATALTPRLGYDEAARLSKRAYDQKKTIRQVALEETRFSKEEIDRLLDPRSMTDR